MNKIKTLPPKTRTKIFNVLSYSSGNALSQVMNMISGFVIIRSLDKSEYGYYTIAFTIYSTLIQLSDIGVTIGLNSIGGRIWYDKDKFSSLIATAESIRRKVISLIFLPVLVYGSIILLSNKNGVINSFSLLALVTIISFMEIERAILLTIPKFHGNLKFIMNNEVLGSSTRLLLVILSAFLFSNSFFYLLPFLFATIVQLFLLKNEKEKYLDSKAKVDQVFSKEIKGYIKSNIINTIYYIFQGQLFILLLTIFGNVTLIGEIGALSRFSVIFNVVNSLFVNYFIPDFAKSKGYNKTKRKYIFLVLINLLIGLVVISIFAIIPQFFLAILGKSYYGLEKELILIMVYSSVINIFGVLWHLNTSQGWVRSLWVYTPLTILSQILIIPLFDLRSIDGIILFTIYSQIAGLFTVIAIAIREFLILKKTNS